MNDDFTKILKHSAWLVLILAVFTPPAFVLAHGWVSTFLGFLLLIIGFPLLVSWTFSGKGRTFNVRSFC